MCVALVGIRLSSCASVGEKTDNCQDARYECEKKILPTVTVKSTKKVQERNVTEHE
jgi:hypothetical protein